MSARMCVCVYATDTSSAILLDACIPAGRVCVLTWLRYRHNAWSPYGSRTHVLSTCV